MTAFVLMAAAAASPIKVAATGVLLSDIAPEKGSLLLDYFTQQLEGQGQIQVTTEREINAVLGLERQKQLMGCSIESASCLAELAGALGVDVILTGTLGKIGRQWTVNLKLVDAATAKQLSSASTRVAQEEALLDFLSLSAKRMGTELKARVKRSAPVATAPPLVPAPEVKDEPPAASPAPSPPRPAATASAQSRSPIPTSVWWAAGASGALASGGLVTLVLSQQRAEALRTGNVADAAHRDALVQEGSALQTTSQVLFAAGVAAAVAATALAFWPSSEEAPRVVLAPHSGGALLGVEGRWE